MELIWGEIAIGLKAVAEEMGHDIANDAELQRCVDVFQGAVRESRGQEDVRRIDDGREPLARDELDQDDYNNWQLSKHNNGYRAPEFVRELEEGDPTDDAKRYEIKRLLQAAEDEEPLGANDPRYQ
jgi:hypothetical protein